MRLNVPIDEVEIYPINPARGIWSFVPQPGVSPVRVMTPPESILREVKNWGYELSVPEDKLVRWFWSANEVMRAATSENGRFSVEGPRYQTAV